MGDISSFTVKVDTSAATKALDELTLAAIKAQVAIVELGRVCMTLEEGIGGA